MNTTNFDAETIEKNVQELMEMTGIMRLEAIEQKKYKTSLKQEMEKAITAAVINTLDDEKKQEFNEILVSKGQGEDMIKFFEKVPNLNEIANKAIEKYKILYLKEFEKALDKQ